MDIKIKAKLSAYTKINGFTSLPLPKPENVGKVLGVGEEFDYEFFSPISNEEIDEILGDI